MVMGKKLVVVYGHVKSFGCGKIWWGGALIFCRGTLTFLSTWEFFGHVVLVMGIFDHMETLNETSLEFT